MGCFRLDALFMTDESPLAPCGKPDQVSAVMRKDQRGAVQFAHSFWTKKFGSFTPVSRPCAEGATQHEFSDDQLNLVLRGMKAGQETEWDD